MTMRYAVVTERAEGNFTAYVLDLPGCIATGAAVEEAERRFAKRLNSTWMDCEPTVWRFRSRRAS